MIKNCKETQVTKQTLPSAPVPGVLPYKRCDSKPCPFGRKLSSWKRGSPGWRSTGWPAVGAGCGRLKCSCSPRFLSCSKNWTETTGKQEFNDYLKKRKGKEERKAKRFILYAGQSAARKQSSGFRISCLLCLLSSFQVRFGESPQGSRAALRRRLCCVLTALRD